MNAPLGVTIKKLRERKNIGLDDLSRAAKIAPETLECIESHAIEPAISDLLKIAAALGTELSALISGHELSRKSVAVTTKEARVRVERRCSYRYESLAPAFPGKHLEPFIISVLEQRREDLDFSRHNGEEFHYVIEGKALLVIGEVDYALEAGDSIYFDASLPHALSGIGGTAKLLTVIYNGESMFHLTRSKYMRDLIAAAKHLGDRCVAVVCPGISEIEAINTGIEEGVIKTAYLVGAAALPDGQLLRFPQQCQSIPLSASGENYFSEASETAIALVRSGKCHMLMKGQINTALFVKAVLHEKNALTKGRRLSMVSIFELPDIDRPIFLTDPGINPALFAENDLAASIDIIGNAIEAARALGVARPKVALLEANELPSAKIPATLSERELSERNWEDADVFGPLSYDLALYKEAAAEKGMSDNAVAGNADILVVPYISGGNFLYKAWAMTMNAEVANLVLGASVPLIMNSRSDTDKTKFLTICASTVYSQYSARKKK